MKKEKDTISDYISRLGFDDLKKLIIQDDCGLWEEHLRLRKQFEASDNPLSSITVSSIEEARQQGYETVSRVLKEFSKYGQLKFSPSHGIGHAIRDYLHALVLSMEDADPREAYIRIVAGTLHDILGCSILERFEDADRSIRHAEASALLFWQISQNIGISGKEALSVYYAIAAHTNYLNGMVIKDNKGKNRKIYPYKKYYSDGRPIYFLHGVQEVDRLDIIGPCGFLRYYFSAAEATGRQYYFGPTGKFYPVDFEKHMRPLNRSVEDVNRDVTGATLRELVSVMAATQAGDNIYSCWDGEKMIAVRDRYRMILRNILGAFDIPISLSAQEKDALFLEFNSFIIERIEPTSEAREVALCLQKMFLSLPIEIQESWFSVLRKAMEEYEEWRNDFQKEIVDIPGYMLSLPILGKADRIIF